MSALVLYTVSISQTPAFQKLESRRGYCTKQDYTGDTQEVDASQSGKSLASSSLAVHSRSALLRSGKQVILPLYSFVTTVELIFKQ